MREKDKEWERQACTNRFISFSPSQNPALYRKQKVFSGANHSGPLPSKWLISTAGSPWDYSLWEEVLFLSSFDPADQTQSNLFTLSASSHTIHLFPFTFLIKRLLLRPWLSFFFSFKWGLFVHLNKDLKVFDFIIITVFVDRKSTRLNSSH